MSEKSSLPPRSQLPSDQQERTNGLETQEWIDSLAYVLADAGNLRGAELVEKLTEWAYAQGVPVEHNQSTPYINTIPVSEQPEYPGDLEIEQRIRSIIRWNAAMMVMRANKKSDGIGGHLASYASSAELLEVGFNHFFRGHDAGVDRDLVFYQGHISPGIYGRSFLEGRFDEGRLNRFRRELQPDGAGLSSYPHPWLMPDYWEFPTVSMGLGPLQAVYQARFMKYLENRGLKPKGAAKVWAFMGDGEMDEPQAVAGLRLAAYENLDNLIFVLNANLQRLDGPVRGNSRVIQDFEGFFRGAGWNVIKVVWGDAWDDLLNGPNAALVLARLEGMVDGESQRYSAFGAAELREKFFNTPELQGLIEGWDDEKLGGLNRGGHDVRKVYAAYKAATEHKGRPTVVIAQTVKGYGLGETAEARNATHQVKKLNEASVLGLRDKLNIPLSDEQATALEFYHPGEDSPEVAYLKERRAALGGFVPARKVKETKLKLPEADFYDEFAQGSADRKVSTTMATVSILAKLLRDKDLGKFVVPIVPDEARTFGMDSLVPRIGIYSPRGQTYTPVDSASLMFYKEATDGQMLEEGITEDGAFASWLSAATSYANHGVPTIPFFVLYSMFGMQRVGDFVWAAGDQRARGFIFGATAGRTTLPGEGLQHQDGNSHLQAYVVPNLRSYDPAFAYELATIVEVGMKRMYEDGIDEFYYVTIDNENEVQPAMPEDRERVKDGIMRGMYLFKPAENAAEKHFRAQILAGGPSMDAAHKAIEILSDYGVAADLWSVTSYKALHQDALEVARHNRLHPTDEPRVSYAAHMLNNAPGVLVAVSDYVKLGAEGLSGHLNRPLHVLGTDGFGRSEAREELRDFFEVDAKHIVIATLHALQQAGEISGVIVAKAIADLGVATDRPAPHLR